MGARERPGVSDPKPGTGGPLDDQRDPGGSHLPENPRWLKRWAAAFVLMFGLIACWSIATPMFGSVDEPAHMARAAAVAHGQIFGRKTGPATINVKVPSGIARELSEGPGCYAFKPYQAANCAPKLRAGNTRGTAAVSTYVGHYPPLYYAIVGLPTLITSQPVALYLMRLVSGALSAAFLAAAFCAGLRCKRHLLAPFGVALAVTPMALSIAGVVNPSGLEVSTAICLWSTALALAGNSELRGSRFLIGWIALSAGFLLQTRGLSPVFAASAVAGTLLLFGWRVWVPVLRDRLAQAGLAFVAACAGFALGWFVVVDPTKITPAVAGPVHEHGLSLLATSYHHYVWMIPQMVGYFGWLDTPAPQVTYDIWYGALAFIGLLAVLRRWWRALAVMALLLALSFIVPILLTAHAAPRYGLVGQGRDWLPLTVSLPLLGSYAVRRLAPRVAAQGVSVTFFARAEARRVLCYCAAALVLAAAFALGWAELAGLLNTLHRFRNGLGNPVKLFGAANWTPPLSPILIVVVAATLGATWCAWAGGSSALAVLREDRRLPRQGHPLRETPSVQEAC